MFQNIAAERSLNKEDVKVNNNNSIFSLKGLFLCIASFLISMVSLKNGMAPFSIAILIAVCSSSIPAGAIFFTTSLGVLAGSGLESFVMYLINIAVFLISIVIFRPIVQPDKNEISKLGRNLVISMLVTYYIRLWFRHAIVEDYLFVLANVLLSYSFYKVFVNSFNIIDRIEAGDNSFASTLEELIAAGILITVACASFAKFGFIGAIIVRIVVMFFIMLFAWKNGPLVGMAFASSSGLILGAIGIIEPMTILIYTIAGVWAGFLGSLGRVPTIITFLLFAIGINVILDPEYITLINMIEYVIASVCILFVPGGLVIPVEDLFRKYTAFEKVENNKLESGKTDEERIGKLEKTVSKIAKRYGFEKATLVAEMENINRSKEAFIEDLFKNLDAFPNNILYEELINTDNGIVDDIYMVLTDDNEVTKEDIAKIFEKRKVILDFNGNLAIREDVNQVVRIVNRTYRINERNFEWKNRLSDKKEKVAKKLKVVSTPVSKLVPEKTVEQENKMSDLEKAIKLDLKVKQLDCKQINVKQTPENKYYIDILFDRKIEGKEKIKTIENVLNTHCSNKIIFLKDTANISDNLYMQKYISEDTLTIQVGIAKLLSSQRELGSGTLNVKLLDNKQLVALSDSREGLKASKEVLGILKHDLANGFEDVDSKIVIESSLENALEPLKASLDMLCFDLFSGKLSYIKEGCMPTYIKKNDGIDKIVSAMSINQELDISKIETKSIKIEPGQTFVMLSRGIVETHKKEQSDEWFRKILENTNISTSKKMAEALLEKVISNSFETVNKDMYIVVIKIANKTK